MLKRLLICTFNWTHGSLTSLLPPQDPTAYLSPRSAITGEIPALIPMPAGNLTEPSKPWSYPAVPELHHLSCLYLHLNLWQINNMPTCPNPTDYLSPKRSPITRNTNSMPVPRPQSQPVSQEMGPNQGHKNTGTQKPCSNKGHRSPTLTRDSTVCLPGLKALPACKEACSSVRHPGQLTQEITGW